MNIKLLKLSKLAAVAIASFSVAFGQASVEDSEEIQVSATILEESAFIDVSSTSVQFGELSLPDSGRSIFGVVGPKVSWKAPNGSKWSIQITTDSPGGLTNSNGDSLQLKFNNSNLGAPVDRSKPTETEFASESAVYRPVLDSTATPADKLALEFGGNSIESKALESSDDDDINFAVAVPSDAPGGVYDATITLDLVILPEGN